MDVNATQIDFSFVLSLPLSMSLLLCERHAMIHPIFVVLNELDRLTSDQKAQMFVGLPVAGAPHAECDFVDVGERLPLEMETTFCVRILMSERENALL